MGPTIASLDELRRSMKQKQSKGASVEKGSTSRPDSREVHIFLFLTIVIRLTGCLANSQSINMFYTGACGGYKDGVSEYEQRP